MATVTINIPVDKEDWVLDGLAHRFGYSTVIPNPDFKPELAVDPITNPLTIDNPDTKAQFAKKMIIQMIKNEALSGHNQVSFKALKAAADIVELD